MKWLVQHRRQRSIITTSWQPKQSKIYPGAHVGAHQDRAALKPLIFPLTFTHPHTHLHAHFQPGILLHTHHRNQDLKLVTLNETRFGFLSTSFCPFFCLPWGLTSETPFVLPLMEYKMESNPGSSPLAARLPPIYHLPWTLAPL
jgi:hypothetical protein